MSLRLKTYLLGGLTLICAVAAIFMISQTILDNTLTGLDQSEMRRGMLVARAAVSEALVDLGTAVRVYSVAGDVPLLTGAGSAQLGNLERRVLEAADGDAAAFVKSDGSLAWARGFDPQAKITTFAPAGFVDLFSRSGSLATSSGSAHALSGIVLLPGGPMLIALEPLLAGQPGMPPKGALAVGRWLDASLLAGLAGDTGLSLQALPPSEENLATAQGADALVSSQEPITVVRHKPTTIAGYLAMEDVLGSPAVVLRVEMPAPLADGLAGTSLYLVLALVGVVLFFGAATILLLESSLFRRLSRLTRQAAQARSNPNHGAPVFIRGKDELAQLSGMINDGLVRLDLTRKLHEEQAGSLAATRADLKGRSLDLDRACRHLQELQNASSSLGSTVEIREALGGLRQVALDIFQADELWLLRVTDDQRLEGLHAFSPPDRPSLLPHMFGCEAEDAWLPAKLSRLFRTAFDGGAVFLDRIYDMKDSERARLFNGPLPDLGGLRSLALVPLIADQTPVGLAISGSCTVEHFSEETKAAILLFAGQVAQALKNDRLYQEIRSLGAIDPVTGLGNRGRSLEHLETEISRATRYQSIFSVVMADIDNFKLFNETYGHEAGDEVIKRVAGVLQGETRASDFVGRYGGDEFILILPETYRLQAAKTADHLRGALGRLPYEAPTGSLIPLRMSFGVASFPEDGFATDELIAVAEGNLYESKRWGGNTVTTQREEFACDDTDMAGFGTLDALVSAVDNKDHYTRRHSAQVAEHSAAIARDLGLPEEERARLQVAALLHDVGKIGLPDRILRKPGALTAEEAALVKNHPQMGAKMVSQHLPEMEEVIEAVAAHHERYDGKGYPQGLAGSSIPLLARILSVADVYSAMTTDRPYRAALTVEEAIAELQKGMGTQLDPEMAAVFIGCIAKGHAVSSTTGPDGERQLHRLVLPV